MMTLDEITYQINSCAVKVHRTLGCGFQEVIYQRCLAIELQRIGLPFMREVEQDIYYEGIHVGSRRVDFVINDQIIVELKAMLDLEPSHILQVKGYLAAYHLPVALLINFGSGSLQFKKVYHPDPSYALSKH